MLKLNGLERAAVFFGVCLCTSPIRIDADPASNVRAQYTASQWAALNSVEFVPLILPSYLPRGFRVSSATRSDWWHYAKSEDGEFSALLDGFEVTYTNGKQTITWSGTNGLGGADVEPKVLQYTFHSPIVGDGLVRRDQRGCWYTDNLSGPHGGTSSGIFDSHTFFTWSLRSCTASPGELAAMAQSVIRIASGVMPGINGNEPSIAAHVTAPAGHGVRILQDPCAARAVAAVLKSGTRVYRLTPSSIYACQGASLVPTQNVTGAWVPIGVLMKGRVAGWYVKLENVAKR